MAKEKCDKNCATCSNDNRSFCAVQMAMANQEILISLARKIETIFESKKQTELVTPICNKDISEPTDSGTATINQ